VRRSLQARTVSFLFSLGAATSCSPRTAELSCASESSRTPSPEGWAIACVVEADYEEGEAMTQVMLDFPEERCGSGAVAASGSGYGLRLRWLTPDTLEVRHPAGLTLERNASGEILQCGSRKVRVVLAAE
jgi:hypothetical protein